MPQLAERARELSRGGQQGPVGPAVTEGDQRVGAGGTRCTDPHIKTGGLIRVLEHVPWDVDTRLTHPQPEETRILEHLRLLLGNPNCGDGNVFARPGLTP